MDTNLRLNNKKTFQTVNIKCKTGRCIVIPNCQHAAKSFKVKFTKIVYRIYESLHSLNNTAEGRYYTWTPEDTDILSCGSSNQYVINCKSTCATEGMVFWNTAAYLSSVSGNCDRSHTEVYRVWLNVAQGCGKLGEEDGPPAKRGVSIPAVDVSRKTPWGRRY